MLSRTHSLRASRSSSIASGVDGAATPPSTPVPALDPADSFCFLKFAMEDCKATASVRVYEGSGVDCGHLLARDRLANMSVANDSREVLPYGRVHTGIPGLPKGKLPEFVQGIPLQCPHVTFKNAFINAGLLIPLGHRRENRGKVFFFILDLPGGSRVRQHPGEPNSYETSQKKTWELILVTTASFSKRRPTISISTDHCC